MRSVSGTSVLVCAGFIALTACVCCFEDPTHGSDSGAAQPIAVVVADSTMFWLPADTTAVYTWNQARAGDWDYQWEMALRSRDGRFVCSVAFVRESEGGPPAQGSFRQLVDSSSVYFWTTEVETGYWGIRPIAWGGIARVENGGVAIQPHPAIAAFLYAQTPLRESGWWATYTRRDGRTPVEQRIVHVSYRLDHRQDEAREVRGPLTADEYAIYHVVIGGYARRLPEPFYLLTPSMAYPPFGNEANNVKVLGAAPDTERDYFEGRTMVVDVSALAALGYNVIDADSLRVIPRDPPIYYARVSRVGFNNSRSQALVYGDFYCGGLCGEGEVVMLELRNGYWVVVGRVGLWIS